MPAIVFILFTLYLTLSFEPPFGDPFLSDQPRKSPQEIAAYHIQVCNDLWREHPGNTLLDGEMCSEWRRRKIAEGGFIAEKEDPHAHIN